MSAEEIRIEEMGQGPAEEVEVDYGDISSEQQIYTHPDLHRRKVEGVDLHVGIYGVNSYRYIETETDDPDSEIP